MVEIGIVKLTIHQALSKGGEALNEGKLDNAEKMFKTILQVQPNNLDANNNLGLIFYKLGKYEEAVIRFKKAISINPNFIIAHVNLGASLKNQEKLDEAIKVYEKVIKLKPNYSQSHNNLGVILEFLEKLDKAELSYKKAINLDPNYSEYHYNLGNIFVKLSKFDEALSSYNKTIELKFNHKNAILNRGQIFFKKGLYELSLKDFDFCDNKKSRPRSVASLYALGKIQEIYERLKKYSKSDNLNLGLAAFSSFITYKEKRNTEFNFCTKPLNFISISNLSKHIDNYELFNKKLIYKLKEIQSFWQPLNKTTIKGFQSKSNLFDNPQGILNELKSAIIKEIKSYELKFQKEDCDFIKKWPKKKDFSCWYVILKKQGHQNAHIHPNGWLSGVLYLKTSPHLKKNEGAIEFSLNGDLYSDINSPKLLHQPKIGDVVLFPSSLHHRTIPFSTDTDRISIAFDLVANL